METRTHKKWLLFLFLTLFALWFSGSVQREVQTFRAATPKDLFDFHVYYIAGQVARSDTDKRLYAYQEVADPHDPAKKIVVNPQLQSFDPETTYGEFAKQADADVGQYLYPPFFSITIIPLTYLSYENAKLLWHIFIFLLACAAVVVTVRLLYRDYLEIALISGVAIIIMELTFPMRDLLLVGNIGSLILFLTVLGIYFHKKYPALGALFFALAVIIKLTPIVVVPLMIIRRQWKWLIAFCGWSALLLGISLWQMGWENHREFVTRVMPSMSNGIPHRDNKSLSTAIYVAGTGKFLSFEEIREGAFNFPEKHPILLFKIITVCSFGALLLFFWYTNKSDSQIRIEILVLTLWSILFAPVSFRHYYMLALAPIVFAWIHPLTKKASSFHLATLSLATFLIFSVLPVYGFVMTDSFPAHLGLFFVMPAGVVLCMLYLMLLLKSQEPHSPAEFYPTKI